MEAKLLHPIQHVEHVLISHQVKTVELKEIKVSINNKVELGTGSWNNAGQPYSMLYFKIHRFIYSATISKDSVRNVSFALDVFILLCHSETLILACWNFWHRQSDFSFTSDNKARFNMELCPFNIISQMYCLNMPWVKLKQDAHPLDDEIGFFQKTNKQKMASEHVVAH